jgi:hypothetical protein
MSPPEHELAPPPEDRVLPYASRRRERGWRRWRVDWVIVVTAVPCALWIWATVAFLLGQPHNRYASPEDELFAQIFLGAMLSSPALVVFAVVVCIRLWWLGRRRTKQPT